MFNNNFAKFPTASCDCCQSIFVRRSLATQKWNCNLLAWLSLTLFILILKTNAFTNNLWTNEPPSFSIFFYIYWICFSLLLLISYCSTTHGQRYQQAEKTIYVWRNIFDLKTAHNVNSSLNYCVWFETTLLLKSNK